MAHPALCIKAPDDSPKPFALCDHTGAYVDYADDLRQAQRKMRSLVAEYARDGVEDGGVAIMRYDEAEGGYTLYW